MEKLSRNYSEDSLVQQTVINHFKYKLKWETAYAYNTEVLEIMEH